MDVKERAQEFRTQFGALRDEIGKVIVGHDRVVEGVLICLFGDGHCLLEGVPGLGKTLLVRTLSQALDLQFSRIQFTPDLMPADIIGTNMIAEDEHGRRHFEFERGPVFANVILADEINRATPKTQSALLEAMQERSVTVAGTRHGLDAPFLVLATQNPLEMEGTYPLPEAQLDRFFFKLITEYPSRDELGTILNRTTVETVPEASKVMDGSAIEDWRRFVREVPIAPHVQDYAVRMTLATHPTGDFSADIAKKYVRYGASPRGVQALVLAGKVRALIDERFNVAFEDIRASSLGALRHRLIVNFEAEADGVQPERIIEEIVEKLPEMMEEA